MFKAKALQILDNSVLQALLSLVVWGGIVYLYVTKGDVPEGLLAAGSLILGFYFQTSAVAAVNKLKA